MTSNDSKIPHVILKWSPFPEFHPDAPDTISIHNQIINSFDKTEDKYVWWGKACVKSNTIGLVSGDITYLRKQLKNKNHETHIYFYCPEGTPPSLHVGLLLDVATTDKRNDKHTPHYYRELTHNIPVWFKIADIKKIDREEAYKNLAEPTGIKFSPVGSVVYPVLVHEIVDRVFFGANATDGQLSRCFKNGSLCGTRETTSLRPTRVFVGMPYQKKYNDVYLVAIEPSLLALGLKPWRADYQFRSIDIICNVCAAIQSSEIAIIDMSEANVNVYFELGLLYGLSKQVILIRQKNSKIPTDMMGMTAFEYDRDDLIQLKNAIYSILTNIQ